MITDQWEALTNERPSWGHRTNLWLVGDEKAHVSKFNFSRSRPDDFPSHFDAARKKLELYLNYPSIVPYLFLFLAQPALHSFYVRGSKYFWIILTSHHYSASGTTALPIKCIYRRWEAQRRIIRTCVITESKFHPSPMCQCFVSLEGIRLSSCMTRRPHTLENLLYFFRVKRRFFCSNLWGHMAFIFA